MKTNFFVFPSVLLVLVAMAATLLAQNSTKQKSAAQNITTQGATSAAKQKTEAAPAERPAISNQKSAVQNVTTIPSERHVWICGGGSVVGPIYGGNCPGIKSASCNCQVLNSSRTDGTRPTRVTEAGIEQ